MEPLFERLKAYGQTDYYPYHMPGHKRNTLGGLSKEIAQIDITEIEGFDNLHQPEGILLKLQEKAAELYHAEKSFYLVNGSTGGILSAISAAVPEGGHILMARNSHKSAYHGAYLRNLTISYLYPPLLEEYDICDAITPVQVEEALKREQDIQAVFLTSPTYEGRIADVAGIADVVHKAGIPLIVDEAHGAHLGLAEGFAQNSCQAGADIVIHSVHKTLPAMTQAALLHVNGNRISRERLQRFLHIYQTSSPSYILMASIDNALRVVERQGAALFARFRESFEEMLEELSECHYLQFLPVESRFTPAGNEVKPVSNGAESTSNSFASASNGQESTSNQFASASNAAGSAGSEKSRRFIAQDIGKLVISTKDAGISGQELYDVLLEEYHLQLEMASASYCLAMFTIGDDKEAYTRMTEALLAIEKEIASKKKKKDFKKESLSKAQDKVQMGSTAFFEGNDYPALPFAKAWDGETEQMPLEQAAGCYAGEFINLYPPGIPLLAPGEQITKTQCRHLAECLQQGLNVQGVQLRQGQYYVSVLKPETVNQIRKIANNVDDISPKERELLGCIRKRPAMFVGEFSLSKLNCFLDGYRGALWNHGLNGQYRMIPREFHEFVSRKYGLSASMGYVRMILQQIPDGKEAVELFFRLLDEFLELNGFEKI